MESPPCLFDAGEADSASEDSPPTVYHGQVRKTSRVYTPWEAPADSDAAIRTLCMTSISLFGLIGLGI